VLPSFELNMLLTDSNLPTIALAPPLLQENGKTINYN